MLLKRTRFMILIGLLALLATACAMPSPPPQPPPQPAPTNTEPPAVDPPPVEPTEEVAPEKMPFEGIWFQQDRSRMLVITPEMLYLHEFEANREVYARIDQVDLDAETIDVFVTAIIMGGEPVGYDSPNKQISYHVNGIVMEFSGKSLDFVPDEEEPVIYILDEFLNPDKE
jgi:hypothetical protein